jgi:hypothetical protein
MNGVTPGDLLVAGSIMSAVLVAYYAVKAQLTAGLAELRGVKVEQASQGRQLAEHGADIRYMARKTASIEGKVFGRRVEDRMPSERAGSLRHPEDLEDADHHYRDTDRS